jgi:hypothetical protein
MKNYFALLLVLTFWIPTASFAIGAVAVDDEAGDRDAGYGLVTGYDTKEEAMEAALESCKKAGNSACRVVSWFETCGAYAASKDTFGPGWGSNASKAQGMAMTKCDHEDCRIVVTECEE